MRVFRTVLGDERAATRTYGDGSVDCPFCTYPVRTSEETCLNPWCDANPSWKPEALAAHREKVAAQQAEEARRKANHEAAMRRIERDRVERQEREAVMIREAEERGACVRCLVRSGFRKRVRHRKRCPRE